MKNAFPDILRLLQLIKNDGIDMRAHAHVSKLRQLFDGYVGNWVLSSDYFFSLTKYLYNIVHSLQTKFYKVGSSIIFFGDFIEFEYECPNSKCIHSILYQHVYEKNQEYCFFIDPQT